MRKYFVNFIKNIIYLMKNSLEQREKDCVYNALIRVEDVYRYEILSENEEDTVQPPKVLNYSQTLDLLQHIPKSFCRFGDGEIKLMQGKSVGFQEYDEELSKKLVSILQDGRTDLYVGINYNYFHSTKELNKYNRCFYLMDIKPYRDFLIETCNKERTYIAAGFNQLYMILEKYNFDDYYYQIKTLFKDRDIVLFSGEGILDKLEYNVFELAKSIKYESGPTKNAFDAYDDIMNRAVSYPKSCTLCFILGPTSKVLVYDLTKEGYMAWDIGHLAKDYNAYKKKLERNQEEIKNFFKPD